jgi:hypothetical protein
MTQNLTSTRSMHPSHYGIGEKRVGSIGRILAGGFSGIAGTTWEGDAPMMLGRYGAGKP